MTFFPFRRKNTEKQSLRDRLFLIEMLIFALPLSVFLYILYEGNYRFGDSQVILFVIIVFLILAGMIVIRQILEKISFLAMSLKRAESGNALPVDMQKDIVELHEISASLNHLILKLERVKEELTQRSSELSAIRDLTEIIKVNLSIDDQMNLLLDKCMAVTGAQVGSVFIVEPETSQKYLAAQKSTPIPASELYRFRVCAARGHHEELTREPLINIDQSVVRATLLEKGPLLVRNISEDPRTLKENNPKYGAPSFLSMPIITGGTVSAILNLANKKEGQLFDENDERVIAIILRDIGFAIENTMLQSRIKDQLEKMKTCDFELERAIEKQKRAERIFNIYMKKI